MLSMGTGWIGCDAPDTEGDTSKARDILFSSPPPPWAENSDEAPAPSEDLPTWRENGHRGSDWTFAGRKLRGRDGSWTRSGERVIMIPQSETSRSWWFA